MISTVRHSRLFGLRSARGKGVVRRYSIMYTIHKLKHIFVLLRVAKGIQRTGQIPHPSVVQGEFGLKHSNIRTNVF